MDFPPFPPRTTRNDEGARGAASFGARGCGADSSSAPESVRDAAPRDRSGRHDAPEGLTSVIRGRRTGAPAGLRARVADPPLREPERAPGPPAPARGGFRSDGPPRALPADGFPRDVGRPLGVEPVDGRARGESFPLSPAPADDRVRGAPLPRSPALLASGLPPRPELAAGFAPRLGAAFRPIPVPGDGFALRDAGFAPRLAGLAPRLGLRSAPGFELARVERGAPVPAAFGPPRPELAPAPRPARPGCARPWPLPRLRLFFFVFLPAGEGKGFLGGGRGGGAMRCPLVREIPAATYSPRGLPPKYHRRGRSSLPCSEWERVFPRRNCHRKQLSKGRSTFKNSIASTSNKDPKPSAD